MPWRSTRPFRFTPDHKRESDFKSLTHSRDLVLLVVLAPTETNCTSSEGNGKAGKVTNFINSFLSRACWNECTCIGALEWIRVL